MTEQRIAQPKPDVDSSRERDVGANTPTLQVTLHEASSNGDQHVRTDGKANADADMAELLDKDLEKMLSDLENPEMFSLRQFFNMC